MTITVILCLGSVSAWCYFNHEKYNSNRNMDEKSRPFNIPQLNHLYVGNIEIKCVGTNYLYYLEQKCRSQKYVKT